MRTIERNDGASDGGFCSILHQWATLRAQGVRRFFPALQEN